MGSWMPECFFTQILIPHFGGAPLTTCLLHHVAADKERGAKPAPPPPQNVSLRPANYFELETIQAPKTQEPLTYPPNCLKEFR